jgi:hypothetical protein
LYVLFVSPDEAEEREGERSPVLIKPPEPRMDLQRFQRLLEKEEISTIVSEDDRQQPSGEGDSVNSNIHSSYSQTQKAARRCSKNIQTQTG